MSYTTTDLIAAVKSIGSIPTSQNLFLAADFLRFGDFEIQTNLVPLLMSVREEYFVADYDYSITADQASYAIPSRAIGEKLRDVTVISDTTIRSLPRLEPSEITSTDVGIDGFYLKASAVVLNPTPVVTQDTLRLSHFRRPSSLVATTACGQITSIDTVLNQVVIGSAPSTFGVGTLVDFVKETPGFKCHAIDTPIVTVAGTTLTFASLPTGLAVGDWIALANQSPIPQLPLELHPILYKAIAIRCMRAQSKNVDADVAELKEMKMQAFAMLTPRVDGEPKKIRSPNSIMNALRWK